MRRRVSTLCTFGLLLLGRTGFADRPQIDIEGPKSAIGDGTSKVPFQVRVRSGSRVIDRPKIQIDVSAGVVGKPRPIADGWLKLELTPPRVLEPVSVSVRVRFRIGGKTISVVRRIHVAASHFKQHQQRSDGAFELRGPKRLLLGASASAQILLRPAKKGPKPRLIVSTGEVSAVRNGPDGWLVATYTPPQKMHPQVAHVVALGGGKFDSLAIGLYGRAQVVLQSEPNASVRVRARDLDLGPVRTDSAGRASLAVAVPPGLAEATTIAHDALGNTKRGRLAMGAPPFERLFAVCPKGGARLLLFAVTKDASLAKRLGDVHVTSPHGKLGRADAITSRSLRIIVLRGPSNEHRR